MIIYLPFVEGLKFLPFCYSRAYTQQRLFIQRNVECEEREFQDSVQFLKNLKKLMTSVCFASLVCFREVSTPASPIIFERGVKRYCSNWKHQWTILLWQNCQHMRSADTLPLLCICKLQCIDYIKCTYLIETPLVQSIHTLTACY